MDRLAKAMEKPAQEFFSIAFSARFITNAPKKSKLERGWSLPPFLNSESRAPAQLALESGGFPLFCG